MNGSSGDRWSSSGGGGGGGGGGYQDNTNTDDRHNDGSDEHDRGQQNTTNHNNKNLGGMNENDEKERFRQLQKSMEEEVERLKSDNLCANEKISMLKEQLAEVVRRKKNDNHSINSNNSSNNNNLGVNSVDQEKLQASMEKVEQLKTDNMHANEKICMMREQLAEVKEKKDGEIALLKSIIAEREKAMKESCEKASAFENQCKELKENVALLNEEIAVLELVCEKMCSSGDYDNELEGLEIEGTNNCLRSHLGSLTKT